MKIRKLVHIGGTLVLTLSLGALSPLSASADSKVSQTVKEELERSEVSSYLIDKSGFFDSGAYERYLDEFVNTDHPPVQNKEQDRTDAQP